MYVSTEKEMLVRYNPHVPYITSIQECVILKTEYEQFIKDLRAIYKNVTIEEQEKENNVVCR